MHEVLQYYCTATHATIYSVMGALLYGLGAYDPPVMALLELEKKAYAMAVCTI